MKYFYQGKIRYILVLCGLFISSEALAEFEITVSPDRGGRFIKFSPIKQGRQIRNEEATVIVATDEAKRYRIELEQMAPLTNDAGDRLDQDAIQIFTTGSFPGTSQLVFPSPLKPGKRTIYTSSSAGEAVSFALVFSPQVQPGDAAGRYRTNLNFHLESTQGGVAPSTYVLPVILEVASEFSFDVENVTGSRILQLSTVSPQNVQGTGAVRIRTRSKLGSPYRIYQQLAQDLSNEMGRSFKKDDAIGYEATSPGAGSIASSRGQVSTSKTLLYESDRSGSPVEFDVAYHTKDLLDEKAGNYQGMIQYKLESNTPLNQVRPIEIPMRVKIDEIFDIEVEYGPGGLAFGKFKYSGDTQERTAHIRAYNNTGQQYRIVQNVSRPMTNEKGQVMEGDYYTLAVKGATKGKILNRSAKPVEVGETTLLVSDQNGSSDAISLHYTLTLPPDSAGGNYSSETSYSMVLN